MSLLVDGMDDFGSSTIPDKGKLATRINDLVSFGLLTATERQNLENMLGAPTPDNLKRAVEIILEKERIGLARKNKPGFLEKVSSKIPAGWGPTDELISGVPNWALYTVGGAFAFMAMRSIRKGRKK